MERFFTLSDSVIAIRSKYFVNVLLRRLGVDKVSQITPALVEVAGAERGAVYSKFRADFYRYKRGENIKNDNLIKAVDKLLPGMARIVSHPIWSLLSTRDPEEAELIVLAQKLEPGLHQILLKHDEVTRAIDFRSFTKSRDWFSSGSKFLRAIDRRGLDELAALLIAVKAHELHGEYGESRSLRELVMYFFIEISLVSDFDGVTEDLYEEVHGVLAKVSSSNRRHGKAFLILAQMMAREEPWHMLETIRRVSAGRASHDEKYSVILRCNRAI
ncbi:hypothetical protein [Pseudomonas sp.]|uniref:hypothetical protein n=1 Tax=Pseudomonas sp. TaxID=306 RepID=UPI003C71D5C5